jgi:hypothetical protein
MTPNEIEEGRQRILDRIPEEWGKYLGVPDEWIPRLIQLDAELAEIDPGYEIHQVKIKFGGLRYYFSTTKGVSRHDGAKMQYLTRLAEIDVEEIGLG